MSYIGRQLGWCMVLWRRCMVQGCTITIVLVGMAAYAQVVFGDGGRVNAMFYFHVFFAGTSGSIANLASISLLHGACRANIYFWLEVIKCIIIAHVSQHSTLSLLLLSFCNACVS